MLTVSLPIGRRQSLRGGVESGAEERAFVEYSRFQTRDLGDYGYDVAIEQRPGGLSGSGSITYNANRAFLRAQHRVITDEDGEDILTEESALSVSTQIAFAGGALAIGRPVGSSFVIVKRHETLDEARVGVRRATRTARAEARAGAFGPALTSIGSAYTPQTMFVDVEDAPEGYDYGPGLYEIFSGPASGHVIQLGSDANRVAIGAITRPDGTPIGLLGGRLRNLDNPEIAEAFVFTNAAGRFVLTGLAPGRHQIVLGQRGEVVFEITIPAEGERIVDLGSIIVE